MARSLLTLAMAGAVAAQSTTVIPLFLPFFDPMSLDGSIVDVKADVTTFAIACAPGVKEEDCGIPSTQQVVQGPSTWVLAYGSDDVDMGDTSGSFSQEVGCVLDVPKNTASCTASISQVDDGTTLTTSTATEVGSLSDAMMPVTITAGLEKLSAAPGSASTTASVASSTSTGTSTKAAATGSDSSATVASQTSSSPKPSTSDNAAGSLSFDMVLAGAVAIIGGAMIL